MCGKRGSEAAGVTATFNFFPALSKREKSKKKKSCLYCQNHRSCQTNRRQHKLAVRARRHGGKTLTFRMSKNISSKFEVKRDQGKGDFP